MLPSDIFTVKDVTVTPVPVLSGILTGFVVKVIDTGAGPDGLLDGPVIIMGAPNSATAIDGFAALSKQPMMIAIQRSIVLLTSI